MDIKMLKMKLFSNIRVCGDSQLSEFHSLLGFRVRPIKFTNIIHSKLRRDASFKILTRKNVYLNKL